MSSFGTSQTFNEYVMFIPMNYQKLIIVGNNVADAELKSGKDSEVKYTRIRVAVNDLKDRPTFFPVTIFGKLAESLTQYLTKGRQVTVEGRIEVDESGRFSVIAEAVKLGQKPSSKSENAQELADE